MKNEIDTHTLGRSNLRAGRHSFGAAAIGNLFRPVPEEIATDAVAAAWQQGVRYFDTAPHYGLGLSERRIGRVLRNKPRDEFVLSTKVGRLLVDNPNYRPDQLDDQGFAVPAKLVRQLDYSRDGVMRSIEASLSRLNLDRIDIVFVHDPDAHYREALEGAFPALEDLRQQGVISSYGAGMNQSEMLADFIRNTDLDVIMLAGRFTLFEQGAMDDLLPLAAERNVSVVAAGVFNSGLLAKDRPDENANYNYEPAPQSVLDRVNLLADICEAHGLRLPQVAAQFPLLHSAVGSVCLGARSRDQVERNAKLFSAEVPQALWVDLAERGLIRPELLGQ
jgi:D-threo-aldose 1-dehydrogenase